MNVCCPHCQTLIRYEFELAGKFATCPQCGKQARMPSEEACLAWPHLPPEERDRIHLLQLDSALKRCANDDPAKNILKQLCFVELLVVVVGLALFAFLAGTGVGGWLGTVLSNACMILALLAVIVFSFILGILRIALRL